MRAYIFLMVAFAVIFAAFATLVFLFQSRATQYIFITIGTLLSVLFLVSETYVLFMVIMPLREFLNFANKAMSRTRYRNRVEVIGTVDKTETYLGMETKSLEVSEIDEGKIWRIRYLTGSSFTPEIGDRYLIESFDDVVLRATVL